MCPKSLCAKQIVERWDAGVGALDVVRGVAGGGGAGPAAWLAFGRVATGGTLPSIREGLNRFGG